MLAKREQLLLEVQERPIIQSIIRLEPEVAAILRIAASRVEARDRWYSYEALKQVASLFVGWNADNPALESSRYYEAVIEAIDALLPKEYEDVNEVEIAS